jgi:hypothetical protein
MTDSTYPDESQRAVGCRPQPRAVVREFGLREWVAALPSGQHAEKMATFDTKVESMHNLPGSAAKGAAKAARRHGYEAAAKAESFYVRDVGGPLLDGEIDRARAWGRQLAASITQAAT